MNKTQQLQAVLTICNAILFAGFKNGVTGICLMICMIFLILSVVRDDQ